jgi:hypothetical protein
MLVARVLGCSVLLAFPSSAISQSVPTRKLPSAHGAFPLEAKFHATGLLHSATVLSLAKPKALKDEPMKPPIGALRIAWSGKREVMQFSNRDRRLTWTAIEGGTVGWIEVRSAEAGPGHEGTHGPSAAQILVGPGHESPDPVCDAVKRTQIAVGELPRPGGVLEVLHEEQIGALCWHGRFPEESRENRIGGAGAIGSQPLGVLREDVVF